MNQAALRSLIEDWTHDQSVEEVTDRLERAGVPAAPIYDLTQALATPHAMHRELLKKVQHPIAGEFEVLPQPVRFSGAGPADSYIAPLLGQHTDSVLSTEIGLTAAQIEGLRARGII
jgi:crotonobetainyl-CoA:carnitine CoA-transferase CaiB-like acyl-CoA transferase